MKRSVQPTQRGYSLPEMLVIIAIIGILSLVTVPNFINLYQGAKLKSSLQQFTTDVRAVRQRAVSTVSPMKVSLQQGATKREYRVYRGTVGNTGTITWTEISLPRWQDSTTQRRLLDPIAYFSAPASGPFIDQDTTADGWLDIIFLPNGEVQFGGTATSGSVIMKTDLKVGKPSYTITMNTSGRIVTQ